MQLEVCHGCKRYSPTCAERMNLEIGIEGIFDFVDQTMILLKAQLEKLSNTDLRDQEALTVIVLDLESYNDGLMRVLGKLKEIGLPEDSNCKSEVVKLRNVICHTAGNALNELVFFILCLKNWNKPTFTSNINFHGTLDRLKNEWEVFKKAEIAQLLNYIDPEKYRLKFEWVFECFMNDLRDLVPLDKEKERKIKSLLRLFVIKAKDSGLQILVKFSSVLIELKQNQQKYMVYVGHQAYHNKLHVYPDKSGFELVVSNFTGASQFDEETPMEVEVQSEHMKHANQQYGTTIISKIVAEINLILSEINELSGFKVTYQGGDLSDLKIDPVLVGFNYHYLKSHECSIYCSHFEFGIQS